jgi:uncharacterized membrane protein SirB2
MDYSTVLLVHQTAVALSITGFFVRGAAALRGAAWIDGRAAKILPHIVDTLLLLSALTLVWMLQLKISETPWLVAKIIGLVLYIGLGMIALRPGRSRLGRASAWIAALAVAAWIVSVAVTKSPLGVFSGGR